MSASWDSPAETFHTNVVGQCNLLEAVKRLRHSDYDPVVQIACSSEEYGLAEVDELPIRETNPLRPLSPYAVSKVAQDLMGYQYWKSYPGHPDPRLQSRGTTTWRGLRSQ